MQHFCKPSEENMKWCTRAAAAIWDMTLHAHKHSKPQRSFFDDFSHAVFSFCKLFNTPLVKKVKYKEQIVNEVHRNNTKIKTLVEFFLSDPTIRVEINLGCCVQIHNKKLLS